MSLDDDARVNAYTQAALYSNNERELEHNMQIADQAVGNAGKILNGAANAVGNVVSGVSRALTEPSPPPKSSGGGLGGLLVLGALAGGAYLLSKAFGSDDKKETKVSNTKTAEDYQNSGNNYMDKKEYELAIQEFTKSIELNPNDYVTYNNRGVSYVALKQYKLAIQDLNKSIQLNPNNDSAYKTREFCFKKLV